MFTNNPFAELSAYIAPGVIQTFIVVMFILVVAGTIIDVIHKKSGKYFFENWQKSKSKANKQVGGGEVASMAVKTLASEVLMSSEFCTARRRIAHLIGCMVLLLMLLRPLSWYSNILLPLLRRPTSGRLCGTSGR